MSNAPSHLRALATADPCPYWTEDADEAESCDTLVGAETADLLVIGGGYTGLWTAILAKEREPLRDVVIVEGERCGAGASGRNGGFFESSLTHGIRWGLTQFGAELPLLEKLGLENLDAIERFIAAENIDCDWERNGVIDIATDPDAVHRLHDDFVALEALGQQVEWFDGPAMQAQIHSPTYHAGLHRRARAAVCDPARLVWGLKAAALRRGVRIYEDTRVDEINPTNAALVATTGYGSIRAPKVALATNAFPPLVRKIRRRVVPVYDYVLCTEPLSAAQLASVGWAGRQGLSDNANQFHYYRLTEDNRILWGGYDAIYYFGSKVDSELEQRPDTFKTLSFNFFNTFPQLEGLNFTHAWGGVIDTCSRFTVFWDRHYGDRLVYAMGYTGLGAAATRFGARVMLDLLDQRASPVTGMDFVSDKPLPFPPEPLRWLGIEVTQRSRAAADRNGGRRNLWLRGLDRLGLGFDS